MANEVMRNLRNFLIALAGVFVVLVVLGDLMFMAPWLLYGVYSLATGWLFFPLEVASQVTIDVSAIALAAIALVLFTIGLHVFLRWLWNARQQTDAQYRWRFRSSIRVVTLIVFSFVAGMSTVGLVHQITWMATTDQPLLKKVGFFEFVTEPADSTPE